MAPSTFVFSLFFAALLLFLFSPLSFVCVALQLGIWPTIDKTQSLTMFGTCHRIGGSSAPTLWSVCVSVEALGRRWDAANVIVYLPFLFQMVLRRKNRIPDMLRPYRTLFPQSACSLYSSHGSVWSGDLVSGPECAAWGAAIAKNAQWDFKENTWKSGGCSWLCGKSWCENICAFRL